MNLMILSFEYNDPCQVPTFVPVQCEKQIEHQLHFFVIFQL